MKKPTLNHVLPITNTKNVLKKEIKETIKDLDDYEVIVLTDAEVRYVTFKNCRGEICNTNEEEQEIRAIVKVISNGVEYDFVWRKALYEHRPRNVFLQSYLDLFEQASDELYEWVKTFIDEEKVTKGKSKVVERYTFKRE